MLYSRENKDDVIGLATGYVDLDRMTSGLQAGELIIIAARPSPRRFKPRRVRPSAVRCDSSRVMGV